MENPHQDWRPPPPKNGEPPKIGDPPKNGTPPQEVGSSIQSMSGRYASYWNAFLILNNNFMSDNYPCLELREMCVLISLLSCCDVPKINF